MGGLRGGEFFPRLGALAIRRRRWVLAAWTALAAIAAVGAAKAPGRLYSGSGDIAGGQALAADSLWRRDFANPYAQSLILAVRGRLPAGGGDSPAALHAALEKAFSSLPEVAAVMTPDDALDKRLLPQPGTGAGTAVLIGLKAASLRDAEQAVPAVRAVADSILAPYRASDPALAWAVTGRSALTYDLHAFNAEDTARSEKRGIPLTAVILLFAFGSLAAAGIPVLLGVLSTTLSMGIICLLAGHWAISNLVENVASMIGLAVGIDYSLFIIQRYREAMPAHGGDRTAALVEAMATSGKAVFLSGLTVLIGLGSLVFTPLMETRSIGWGGCLAVLAAMALSLTLLPALLSLLGSALDWPPALSRRLAGPGRGRRWQAWSRGVLRHAPWAAALGLGAVLLLAWPGRHTRFGFPEGPFIPKELEFSRGLAMLTDMGLAGLIAPVHIILSTGDGGPILAPERLPGLHAFSARLRSDPRVARVLGPGMDAPGATAPLVRDYFLSRDGRSLLMQAILVPGAPLEDAKALAREVPGMLRMDGIRLVVGGQAAYYNDFDKAMAASYPPAVGFVLAATFLAMLAYFRSPLVSLKALVMNALSVLAGYGAVVWVFQMGNCGALFGLPGPAGVVPLTIPLLLFGIVFGLSMDYEVILLSRIREIYLATGDNDRAVAEGLAASGRMITGAALIMVAVFGVFAFARVIVVQMLGLGLAVAVLVDALVIRCLLVPAFMKLAGDWNWWPGARPSRRAHRPQSTSNSRDT